MRGVDLRSVSARFGLDAGGEFRDTVGDLESSGMLEREGDVVRLTASGRLLSNEVFERFIGARSTSGRSTRLELSREIH